jgi:iron complex transport system substrate-binding protein
VLDGAGRDVKVPARPARIVSLAPSVTEILFALGAGERVVGVTDYCDFPPEARSRTRIGGLINPDLEKIVSLKPDLAMATTTGNYLDDAERIERLGIPVYTINTPTVESMLKTLETIGDLVGEPARSRTLSGQLRSRIDRVRVSAGRHARVRTLFVIEGDPLIAPGRGTFLGEALAIAGADLVTKDAPASWGQYDLEQVIRMKPELLLTAEPNRGWALGLTRRPEWLGIPAVAGHHVVVISDSIQHPGPRLVDGIEEVGKIVQSMGSPGKKP